MISVEQRKPTEPLASLVRFFGVFMVMLMGVVGVLVLAGIGHASVGGFGDASVCVNQPHSSYSGGMVYPGVSARPGALINFNAALEACANHPSVGERFLYTLTNVSSLVWLGLIFLLWRIVRAAEAAGPFTPKVARLLRFTGWFIIIGSIAAASAQGAATDALLNMTLNGHDNFGDAIPVPNGGLIIAVLAGAVALTFARITRLGTRMDEDLQGTV
jgi:hypothetical protein